MLTFVLVSVALAQTPAPAANASPALADPPASVTLLPAAPVSPLLPLPKAFEDAGKTLLRPFQPKLDDLWLWIPTAAATTAAMVWDVPLYHELEGRWPDPEIGGERLSYWGSFLGEWYIDVGVLVAVGLTGGPKEQAVCRAGLEALAAVGVFSRALKLTFRLERPSFDGDEKHWFSRWNADAFPSGHTMTAFATAAVLASAYPNLAPLFYAIAAYVGVARVQQSTHWVSDVTFATAFGLLFGWTAYRLNSAVEIAPSAGPAPGLALRGTF